MGVGIGGDSVEGKDGLEDLQKEYVREENNEDLDFSTQIQRICFEFMQELRVIEIQ